MPGNVNKILRYIFYMIKKYFWGSSMRFMGKNYRRVRYTFHVLKAIEFSLCILFLDINDKYTARIRDFVCKVLIYSLRLILNKR